MVVNDKLNLTMLCDFYELTMSQGYFTTGYKDRIAYFDLFFRRCPDGGGFAIAAGLEQIIEYIRMPESLIGKGEFFALIAKGESMVDAGIHPGDYVVIRKQNTADLGDIVVALDQGVNNLKVLGYDKKRKAYFLRSCNEDKERYADIYPEALQIQGIAVSVTHKLGKIL